MHCSACGTALADTAQFCHKCGARVASAPPSRPGSTDAAGWRAGLPWGLAGIAVGALIVVVAMRGAGSREPGAGLDTSPTAPGITDISRMSPEEMARRLFDRTMRLAEEGKRDSVAFFAPMAIQTYDQLPALDNDARYDLGLLHLAAGNPAAALAQADTLLRAVPTHLYGFMVRARAYQAQGDAARARRAFQDFLRNEAAERQRARPEYANHQGSVDAFHAEAIREAGTPQ
jgi:hypothetical protein